MADQSTKELLERIRVILYKALDLAEAVAQITGTAADDAFVLRVRTLIGQIDPLLATNNSFVLFILGWLLSKIGLPGSATPRKRSGKADALELVAKYIERLEKRR